MFKSVVICKMTDRVLKAQGLKSIRKQCEQITIEKNQKILIVSSPSPESIISSVILCRALLKLGSTFHITFSQPVIEVSTLNIIQKTYSATTTFIIGVDVLGKKNIRKEKNYPIFIGGTHQSKQANIISFEKKISIPIIGYVLAEQKLETDSKELQLAAIGILLQNHPKNIKDKIAKAIVSLAQKDALIEERKGFKLFGTTSHPLMEILAYSIYPYLSNISGKPETCEKILDDAEIPFSKRRIPINALSTEEIQSLTKQLIPRLNQSTIPQVLGQDFILTHERENSPIQTISSIHALARYSWSQWKIGAMFSIWMGDHSRILRKLIDSYLAHSKNVIASFNDLESRIKQGDIEPESTESVSIYKIPTASNMILSDLGRITFDENLVHKNHFLILVADSSIELVWDSQEIALTKMIIELKSLGLNPISTSSKSIRIDSLSQESQQILLETLQKSAIGK